MNWDKARNQNRMKRVPATSVEEEEAESRRYHRRVRDPVQAIASLIATRLQGAAEPHHLLHRLHREISAGNLQEALRLATIALDTEVANPARFLRALVFRSMKQNREARADLEILVKNLSSIGARPECAKAQLVLAQIYSDEHAFAQGAAMAMASAENDPQEAEAQLVLAHCLLSLDTRYAEEAASSFRDAIKLGFQGWEPCWGLTKCSIAVGDSTTAAEMARMAVQQGFSNHEELASSGLKGLIDAEAYKKIAATALETAMQNLSKEMEAYGDTNLRSR